MKAFNGIMESSVKNFAFPNIVYQYWLYNDILKFSSQTILETY